MRHVVTFVVRLWVDAGAGDSPWQGEVECIATGERLRFQRREDLLRFIESEAGTPPKPGARRHEPLQ